jgi:hypothetical protein
MSALVALVSRGHIFEGVKDKHHYILCLQYDMTFIRLDEGHLRSLFIATTSRKR